MDRRGPHGYWRAACLLGLVALIGAVAAAPVGADPSITLNEPSPVYGQSVTFSATYPKEATRKVGRQQMWNPAVQVDCYQDYAHVFSGNNAFFKDTHNADGSLSGVSGSIVLGTLANENTWTGGAASCVATLFYFGHDELIHVLAQTWFEVAP